MVIRKVDWLEYTMTQAWIDEDPSRMTWLEEYDPGMAYIEKVMMGKIPTPKRVPDPEKVRHGFVEIPRSQYIEFPPGSIESFVYPYHLDLDDLLVYMVSVRGPCHGDAIVWESLGGAYEIVNDAVGFFESDEIYEALYKICSEGRISCPDGDHIVDVASRPALLDMEPIRMVELFAGIGAFRKAAYNLGIPHTSVMSEINEFATMSYQAIHGETDNLGDISKVDALPECDLLTYGFPCQDVSIAGNMAGFEEGSGTRSSLLWEVRRLLDGMVEKPKVLIMENVANLVSKKFMPGFQRWIDYLESIGYVSTWQVVNATQVGVPQNRRRVLMVSVLDGPKFEFPDIPSEKDMEGKLDIGTVFSRIASPLGRDDINSEGIRMLTPTECFRLMGFTDRDAFRASVMCSDSQLFKQTGNSIVVDVLEMIYRQLIAQGIWSVRS